MSPVRPLRGSQEDATRGFSERPRGVVDRAGLRPRVRFWGETAVAVVCGVLAIATVFWQDWIEALTGFDPDHHGGSAEWLIVGGLALVCVLASLAGRAEWRRTWVGAEADRVAA